MSHRLALPAPDANSSGAFALYDANMNPETLDAIRKLFSETFIGIGNENGTYFNDSSANSGICGVLDRIPADIASRVPRPGGKTIVGHTRHMLVYTIHVAKYLRNEKNKVDWSASFDPQAASIADWDELRGLLRRESDALLETIATSQRDGAIASAIGAIAHGAYHLGAIKQILLAVQPG